MDFVAIDVETANADLASICQIGIATYADGKLCDEWSSLVNPEDYFDDFNVSIHGITSSDVKYAPTFLKLAETVRSYLEGSIVVSHTHFDRVSINQVSSKYGIEAPHCVWLDSARVARRAWEEFAWSGYGLEHVCSTLNYEFKHHDALEDAKAAGYILLKAIKEQGIGVDGWLDRVGRPIDPTRAIIKREGNPDGPLYGEVIVFTGALALPRTEAADKAAQIGCRVDPGVTKRTTLLVVGDQDIRKLAGHEISNKHQKAKDLIAKGLRIRIIRESDFKELVGLM